MQGDYMVTEGVGKIEESEVRNRQSHPALLKDLIVMSKELAGIYGDALDRIILYGSYARGEQTEASDIDIAVLIRGSETKKMHEEMLDLVVDYELELAVTLSVIQLDFVNYSEWKHVLPFYKNIDREGIILWKAA